MPLRPKVLVAMSGGVDSSVAAALLVQRGFDVVGVFMRLGSPGEALEELIPGDEAVCEVAGERTAVRTVPPPKIGHQGCCSINDAADARLVAAQLGVPFYVVNFKREFGRIMDYFAGEYAAGRTPNPCVRCNDWLKFGKLHEYAGQIGADFVASGHYARIVSVESRMANGAERGDRSGDLRFPTHHTPRLLAGLDADKDQSYVLFGVPRAQLPRMLLPIGDMHKRDVRAMAQRLGLPVFDKPDSQEICFVPDNDYAGFVERRIPLTVRARGAGGAGGVGQRGAILDTAGRTIGEHGGQHRFTIGQRRGVGVAVGEPVFVVAKDASANTITVGPRSMLMSKRCTAGEANWLMDRPAAGTWRACMAKFRYNTDAEPARVRVVEDGGTRQAAGDTGGRVIGTPSGRTGRFEVEFDEPQEAVTPGQAMVLYDRDEPAWVLGGGWIESVR